MACSWSQRWWSWDSSQEPPGPQHLLGCSSCEMEEEQSQGRAVPRRQANKGSTEKWRFQWSVFSPLSSCHTIPENHRWQVLMSFHSWKREHPSVSPQASRSHRLFLIDCWDTAGAWGIHVYIKLVRDGAKSRGPGRSCGAQPGAARADGWAPGCDAVESCF